MIKLKNNKGKYILRKILSRYIPSKLINRPKNGVCLAFGKFFKNKFREVDARCSK